MRWAIGFLLVINVTIFLWGNLTQNSTITERRSSTTAAAPGIEIPTLSTAARTADAVSSVLSGTEVSGLAAEHQEILPQLPPRAERGVESASDPVPADRDSGIEADARAQSGNTASIPGAPVSKNEAQAVRSEQTADLETSDSAPDSPNRLYCGQIGPVPKASEAESVRSRLAEAGLQPVLQEVVKRKQKGFWVLIPPLPTRKEGERTLAELTKKGVKDTWLFKRGELNNAISLGLYNRRNNAEQRRKQLQSLGFDVEVWPRVEPVSQFQVSFSGADPEVVDRVRRLIPRFESRDDVCSRASPSSPTNFDILAQAFRRPE